MTQGGKNPKILNITQVAQYIDVPTVTLRYWLKNDTFPVPPIPGMKPMKWRVADIQAFLAGRNK